MIVTVIGLGLIGGSFALDLKTKKIASKILGVDNNELHQKEALEYGIVDEIVSLDDAIKQSEVIILAIPVDSSIKLLPKILDSVTNQLVFDVGSVKHDIIEAVKNHKNRKYFVASHPMAGTEFSGPKAAFRGMFKDKTLIICNKQDNDPKILEKAENIFKKLEMRLLYFDALQHDMNVAYVSHISHISSFALALTVLEKDESNIFNLAAGGFESTVRLAKSSSEMWTPIMMLNRKFILEVLDTYIEKLMDFKRSIRLKNPEEITELIQKSNDIKRILK